MIQRNRATYFKAPYHFMGRSGMKWDATTPECRKYVKSEASAERRRHERWFILEGLGHFYQDIEAQRIEQEIEAREYHELYLDIENDDAQLAYSDRLVAVYDEYRPTPRPIRDDRLTITMTEDEYNQKLDTVWLSGYEAGIHQSRQNAS